MGRLSWETMPPRFTPPRWLRNAHLQTIYGSLLASAPRIAYRRERWDTPDGDFVDVDFVDGPADAPWVQLFHGLEGSSQSPYARMLMDHVRRRGWRGSVMIFRGLSGEMNRLPRCLPLGRFRRGRLGAAQARAARRRRAAVRGGVSLGGNALAKWLGERGAGAATVVTRAAAVSAPLDLMIAGHKLGRGLSRLYGRHFLASLRRGALAKHERFPGIFDPDAVRRAKSLYEFDNVVTAPLHGFRDTEDYWTRASSKPWLKDIVVPTLILNARDDPFLPESALPQEREVSSAVKLEFPSRGGHVGFVTGPFPGHIEWLSRRLMHFFEHAE
jgi:predicted alpha/beta-fold hydrolase